MRLPNAVHEALPWRIREIAPDFTVEDLWALPAHGDAGDLPTLLEVFRSLDFPSSASLPARALWSSRDRLGRWFGLGRISAPVGGTADAAGRLPIPGTNETSLAARLPDELRGTASPVFGATPFVPLYRTDDEYAAELSNRTVHAVLHLAWADQGGGHYRGQMAVYVKPRGRFGKGYMALIKPFRYAVVYPALLRQIERAWKRRVPMAPGAVDGAGAPRYAAPTRMGTGRRATARAGQPRHLLPGCLPPGGRRRPGRSRGGPQSATPPREPTARVSVDARDEHAPLVFRISLI
jgi:Protein of unknown function (DUF2867)